MAYRKLNPANRIVFGSRQRGQGQPLIPEVVEVGWGHFAAADSGHLPSHTHGGAFELCLIVAGEVEWGTPRGTYVLRAGDSYVTQPGERHWGRDDVMHPCTLYWLILGSPSEGFEWPGMDTELVRLIDASLRAIPVNKVRGTQLMREEFRRLFQEYTQDSCSSKDQLLRRGSARATLHRLLIEVVRSYEHNRADVHHPKDAVSLTTGDAIEFLREHASAPDALELTCETLGVAYRTLNQQFMEHLGTTLAQFWLRERVRMAREQLLREDATVTDVACRLGFSSSQHFATTFRMITGLTPSGYRARRPASCTLIPEAAASQTG